MARRFNFVFRWFEKRFFGHFRLEPEVVARLMERAGFRLTTFPADHPEVWTCAADNLISISLIVAFTWLYSTTGGLRSVVSTDVGQFAIMVVATAVYAAFVLWHVGGLDVLPARLASLYGAHHSLEAGPRPGGGFNVTIEIPFYTEPRFPREAIES